ncbi:MAG: fused MFS/spermidine synthase, partial [Acidobacteriota bacterium]
MAPSPSASFLARLRFFLVVVLPAAILMALEMVSSRLLAPHFGNSVYVWGSIIGVFLAAMSLGYAWGGRLADRRPTLHTLGLLLLGSAALQALVLTFGEGWTAALGRWTSASPSGTLIACGLLFAPPTVLLSTVSPFVVRLAAKQIELLGDTAGRLFAMSTAGSLAGTLGATFVLIPTLPLDAIFRLLMAATVVSSMLALSAAPRRSGPAFAIAAALGLYALVPRVAPLDDFVRERRQTAYQQLEVHATGTVRALYSNGVPQSMDDLATGRSLLPPVNGLALAAALVPTPERALIIGMGSGSLHSLERAVEGLQVDLVDVDPGVVDLAREHFALAADARTFADDGRRFLGRRPDDRWDIIVVDTYIGSSLPFHLSTQEFFQEIRRHQTP